MLCEHEQECRAGGRLRGSVRAHGNFEFISGELNVKIEIRDVLNEVALIPEVEIDIALLKRLETRFIDNSNRILKRNGISSGHLLNLS